MKYPSLPKMNAKEYSFYIAFACLTESLTETNRDDAQKLAKIFNTHKYAVPMNYEIYPNKIVDYLLKDGVIVEHYPGCFSITSKGLYLVVKEFCYEDD